MLNRRDFLARTTAAGTLPAALGHFCTPHAGIVEVLQGPKINPEVWKAMDGIIEFLDRSRPGWSCLRADIQKDGGAQHHPNL